MTETELYDITRGYWRINIKRAQYVDYAMSVYKDTIKEVYKIEKWLPAGTIPRTTLPDAEVPEGRYEFKGKIADKEIRDKYIGKSIANISTCQNPIKYFNCVPNKEEICNNAVIEKAQKIEEEISSLNVEGASKKAIINARVNQGIFRDLLLKRYNKCCLCGVENHELLIASHIKPWAKSEAKEKLDDDNGFLMCPNHDKLFDKGYITF
ncbi:MAG: HNH endonuclease, partial [Lachnospiraceae bacterium]|nr:HNH endonuclease [Lachnospiraceae bacterium]